MARVRTAATTALMRNKEKQCSDHGYTATITQMHSRNCLQHGNNIAEYPRHNQLNNYSNIQMFK